MINRMSFLIIVIFACVLHVKAQDTTKVLKATPVVAASATDQKDAEEKTRFLIQHISQAKPLYEKFILVGPRLWDKLKTDPQFQSWIDESDLTFKVPTFDAAGAYVSKEDMKGKVIQDEPNYLKLMEYISKNLDLGNMKIVEKNNRDKFIFWQYFAKVEEPVIAVENAKARLLLKFTSGRLFLVELSSH